MSVLRTPSNHLPPPPGTCHQTETSQIPHLHNLEDLQDLGWSKGGEIKHPQKYPILTTVVKNLIVQLRSHKH